MFSIVIKKSRPANHKLVFPALFINIYANHRLTFDCDSTRVSTLLHNIALLPN